MRPHSLVNRLVLLGVLGLAALCWGVANRGHGDQPKKTDGDKPKASSDEKAKADKPKADKDEPKAGDDKPKTGKDQPKAAGDKPKAGNDEPKPGGNKPKEDASGRGKGELTKVFFGVAACAQCHNRDKSLEDKDFPPLCRCTEVGIWKKQDKHEIAHASLTGERGKQMAKLLNKDVTKADAGCLGCHAVVVPENVQKDRTFHVEEGVSCVVCHGAYRNWVLLHGSALQSDREEWRALTREKKEKEFGMTDMWDASKRTRMCVSCHIGNTEEGKIVTHAMYAAGHPPLPSVEIATFSDEMPRHWQYLKEKDKEVQKLLQFTPKEAEFERTKLVMVSGVASLRGELRMIASEAGLAAKAKDADNRILDLAQYDCFACHHELKRPSYRAERGYPGTPGRPNFRPWPLALVRVGMELTGHNNQKELHDKLTDVYKAFDVRPFGDASKIEATCGALATWCDGLIAELVKANIDENSSLSLLQRLCKLAETEMPDYDTARQMAWAFRTIYNEWDGGKNKAPGVAAELDALDKELKLKLPATQEQSILKDLEVALQKRAAYDPGPFQKHFQALSKQLSAAK